MALRLREAREYLNFSQEEVANSLGISRPAVTNIESGARKVDSFELDRLSRLYGRSVAYFISGADSEAEDKSVAFAARALRGLSERDLLEVAKFANYLRNTGGFGTRRSN
jgi:transcriptional regulator with XRE-family HTH domain